MDARGVTGLTDAARWAASLKLKKNGDVEFAQSKSNYSAPMKKPLTLKRERGGLLRIASESELEQGGQDEVDSEIAAVARIADQAVEALRGKKSGTIDGIARRMRMRSADARRGIKMAIDEERIVKTRIKGTPWYTVPESDVQGEKKTPRTPGDAGTPSLGLEPGTSTQASGRPGTLADVGTPTPCNDLPKNSMGKRRKGSA